MLRNKYLWGLEVLNEGLGLKCVSLGVLNMGVLGLKRGVSRSYVLSEVPMMTQIGLVKPAELILC